MTESEVIESQGPQDLQQGEEAVGKPEEPQTASPLALRVAAELVGTFLICFIIYAAYTYGSVLYQSNLILIVLVTGLAYTVVTMLFARISRVQLNPAITVAALLTSKTALLDGVLYLVAQVVGAIAAGGLIRLLLPTSGQLAASSWYGSVVNGFSGGSVSDSTLNQLGVEFNISLGIVVEIIAGILIVATALTTWDHEGGNDVPGAAAIGIAYGVGAAITYPITGAGLNPARSTGIAIFTQNIGLKQQPLQQLWVFWIAPVLAAAVVALVMISLQLVASGRAGAGEANAFDDEGSADEGTDGDAQADAAYQSGAVEDDFENAQYGTGADGRQTDGDVAGSAEQKDAQVGAEQTNAQHDADEGVKRD